MKAIWVPISGQIAQQEKVDVIANNIANSNTIGFKKDDLAFREYVQSYEDPQLDIDIPRKNFSTADMYREAGVHKSFVKSAGGFSNFNQGQLNPTNNPLDFAINGDGFFEVLTPQGIRFTRRGNFSVNANGELVTDSNDKLLKARINNNLADEENPESRIIKVNGNLNNAGQNNKIVVTPKGEIFQNLVQLGKMSVIEFSKIQELQKDGAGKFKSDNNQEIVSKNDAMNSEVKQGFLEASNVNALTEMSELIKAHRQFEQIQKAVQAYDSINGKAVNDLMKF